MNSTDELDRIWRDGLTAAASDLVISGDPKARVVRRARHRRRVRRAGTAVGLVLLSGSALVAVSQIGHDHTRTGVATQPGATITTVVHVEDAPSGRLTIEFPGRTEVGDASLALPSGLVRFEISGAPGHELVIDGVSGRVADFAPTAPGTITRDVQLDPGEYLMHCIVPGHTEAGEEVTLRVST